MRIDRSGQMGSIGVSRGAPAGAVSAVEGRPAGRLVEDEIDLVALMRVLWRGKAWIVLAGLLALGWGWYRANVVAVPMFTAHAVVAMETRDENVLEISGVVTGLPGTLGTINTELGVLRSRGLIEKLVGTLDLGTDPEFNPRGLAIDPADPDGSRAAMDGVIDRVLARLAVSNEPESYLFNIAATTRDPEKSARIANALARLYIEDQIEVKYRATEQATEWLTQRLGTLQDDLEAAEGAVEAFTSENRIVRAQDLELLNLRIDSARERLEEAQATEAELGAHQAALRRAEAAGDVAAFAREAHDATLDRLLLADAGADTVAARQATVLAGIEVDLDRARAQGETLANSLDVLRAEYGRASDNLVAFQQLEREVEASRAIYEYFLGRLKELSAQQGNLRADSRVISPAAIPRWASSPKTARIQAMALIVGLVAGAAAVLMWDLLRVGFRAADELEAATGHTVLGQIPLVPRTGRGEMSRGEVLSYFVEKPTSMATEAVRNLRTSVLLSSLDRPPRVIMLTSSLPGEGKTTTSIALAQNFTGLGKRVLLIEGDIRHRVFHDYLDLKRRGGLLDVLSGEVDLADAVERNYLIDADVLVGERAAMNAADVFSSGRFRALIAEARASYDVVIIDTPPVLVVPDARVVAQLADAVVYVVEWNKTSKRDVAAGLRMLSDAGIDVTGLALARIDTKKLRRYGHYTGYGTYDAQKKYGKKYYDA